MSERSSYKQGEFCWVDLVAHDMQQAMQFYGDFLGWTCIVQDTKGGPPYGVFELDGRQVAGIGQMSDEMKAAGVPPMWNSYISVEDVKVVAAKAAELGAKVTVPAMQVLDAGWLAFLEDPTGASVALWQPINHFGAQLVNSVGACCWNELATRDVAGARQFYGDLFGWEFEDNCSAPSTYYFVKMDGRECGGIMQMDEHWGEIPPYWAVYFTVGDVADAVNRLGELGGKVIVPPFEISVGRMAVVADPHGAVSSLIELTTPPD